MRESYEERRLRQNGLNLQERRIGSNGSPGGWLRLAYTPRWRYHLAVLLIALLALPFGVRAQRVDVAAAANPALALFQDEAARPAVRYHTVADGESLESIAARHGLGVDTVRWANGLADLDPIVIGQELVLPPADGVLHYLASGESVREVARSYGVDVDQVAAQNGVRDVDRPLRSAQLMVPGARPRLAQAVAALGPVGAAADAHDRPEGASLFQFADVALWVVEDAEHAAATRRAAATPARSWEEIQREAERATAAAVAASRRQVPEPTEYTVLAGDTITGLAERYGVTPLTIIAANGLLNSNSLSVGQTLVVPPVTGVLYRVQEDDTLSEIAQRFQVDLGPIVDYNKLENAHTLAAGQRLVIPGAEPQRPRPPAPATAPAASAAGAVASSGSNLRLAATGSRASSAPAAVSPPTARRTDPAPPAVPVAAGSGKGGAMVALALQYLGRPYIWGGTGPHGFDCSGFVYFVHRQSGIALSRGMMGQYTAGPRIPQSELQPGDIVFFSNTYMPGLSHNGIYIGGGKFVHASDPSVGVVVTPMASAYWASRYSGATRVH
jgi:cell wall-associated NlpC family hydrolase